jgi:hypothetical protein
MPPRLVKGFRMKHGWFLLWDWGGGIPNLGLAGS